MAGAKSWSGSSHSAQIWARAAHDLRQPVQAMLLQVSALEQSGSKAERTRAARRIEAALLSMREMLEMLALLARIEGGLQEVSTRAIPLDEALAPIAEQVAAAAWARNVEFRCTGAAVLVRSHPTLLPLAIRSLLLNAVVLGSSGKICVDCHVRGEDISVEASFTRGQAETGRERSTFVMPPLVEGKEPAAEAVAGELGLGPELLEHLCGQLGHTFKERGKAFSEKVLAIVLPRAR